MLQKIILKKQYAWQNWLASLFPEIRGYRSAGASCFPKHE
jgi:hypothetical protein